jgi:hypothetical protein
MLLLFFIIFLLGYMVHNVEEPTHEPFSSDALGDNNYNNHISQYYDNIKNTFLREPTGNPPNEIQANTLMGINASDLEQGKYIQCRPWAPNYGCHQDFECTAVGSTDKFETWVDNTLRTANLTDNAGKLGLTSWIANSGFWNDQVAWTELKSDTFPAFCLPKTLSTPQRRCFFGSYFQYSKIGQYGHDGRWSRPNMSFADWVNNNGFGDHGPGDDTNLLTNSRHWEYPINGGNACDNSLSNSGDRKLGHSSTHAARGGSEVENVSHSHSDANQTQYFYGMRKIMYGYK